MPASLLDLAYSGFLSSLSANPFWAWDPTLWTWVVLESTGRPARLDAPWAALDGISFTNPDLAPGVDRTVASLRRRILSKRLTALASQDDTRCTAARTLAVVLWDCHVTTWFICVFKRAAPSLRGEVLRLRNAPAFWLDGHGSQAGMCAHWCNMGPLPAFSFNHSHAMGG